MDKCTYRSNISDEHKNLNNTCTWDNAFKITNTIVGTYNHTWENKNNWIKVDSTTIPFPQPTPLPPTDDQLAYELLSRVSDSGFFEDCLRWLKSSAPRKLRSFLDRLCLPMHKSFVSYEALCEAVYLLGFRADEVIERRMILGVTNKWVQLYFQDFPIS
jgi:hypothetical protein